MENITLHQMLPYSLQKDKTIKVICDSIQPYLNKVWKEINYISIYKNIDILSEDILDHLAYAFHVDFYKDDLEIEKKRHLIKNSIKYHMYKGTPWAVEDLLSSVFNESWIKEWYEYNGEPYFFKLFTKDKIKNEEQFNDFINALYTVKNTRSWLECFVIVRSHVVKLYSTAIYRKTKHMHFYPYSIEGIKTDISINQLACARRSSNKHFKYYVNKEDLNVSLNLRSGAILKKYSHKYYGFNRDGIDGFLMKEV